MPLRVTAIPSPKCFIALSTEYLIYQLQANLQYSSSITNFRQHPPIGRQRNHAVIYS
jgi:hypothetical protein